MSNASASSLNLSATSMYEQAADRGLPDPFDTHHSRTSLRSLEDEDDSIDGDFYGGLGHSVNWERSMSERHLQRSIIQLEAENERLRAERDAALLRTLNSSSHVGMNQSMSAVTQSAASEDTLERESIRDYGSMPAIPAQASLRKLSNEKQNAYAHGKSMHSGRSSADAAAGGSIGHGKLQLEQQGSDGDISVQCVMSLKLELAELRTQYEELQHSQRLQSQNNLETNISQKLLPSVENDTIRQLQEEVSNLRRNLDNPEDVELLQNRLRHVHSQKTAMSKTMQRMAAEKKLVEVQLEAAQTEALQYKARTFNMEQTISNMSTRLSTMKDELEETRRLLNEARQAAATGGSNSERRKSNEDLRSMVRRNKSLSLSGPGGLFGLCSISSARSFDDIFQASTALSPSQSQADLIEDDHERPRGRQSVRRGGRRPRRSRSLDPDDIGKAMSALLVDDISTKDFSLNDPSKVAEQLGGDRTLPPVPSTLTLSVQKVLKSHQASSHDRNIVVEKSKNAHDSMSIADYTSSMDFELNNFRKSSNVENSADDIHVINPSPHERPGSVMSLDRTDWIDNVVSEAFATDTKQKYVTEELKIDSENASIENLGLEELPERKSSLNQAA